MILAGLIAILKDHPWRSYVMVNLVLVVLEKLVEQDFVCPCEVAWTFFLFYLTMPLLLAINFGTYLWKSNLWSDSETPQHQNGSKCSCRCCVKFMTCTVPSVFWLVLFFADGRYVSCLITANHTECDSTKNVKENFAIYIPKITIFSFIAITLIVALIAQCYGRRCGRCCGRCCAGCCVGSFGGCCEAYFEECLASRLKCVAKRSTFRAESFMMVDGVVDVQSSKQIADCALTDGQMLIVAHLENEDCQQIDENQSYYIRNYRLTQQNNQMKMFFSPLTTVYKTTSEIFVSSELEEECKHAICPPSKEDKKPERCKEYYTLQGNIITMSTVQLRQTKHGPVPVLDVSLQCEGGQFEVYLWREVALTELSLGKPWKITHLLLKPEEEGCFNSTAYTTLEKPEIADNTTEVEIVGFSKSITNDTRIFTSSMKVFVIPAAVQRDDVNSIVNNLPHKVSISFKAGEIISVRSLLSPGH
ncbi:uncharacterized protein LOC118800187 [Colossoma macropomum]|uniref:uncharacterized protein LOC118800187 n=1 Tax=Colossoma macropomum TaxID=42526 RepID=UPI001864C5A5|nr:uncharacterized protein LOC118800187 [Colossoma macropomum]